MAPRRRRLTNEEQSLWDEVARTAKPLRPPPAKSAVAKSEPAEKPSPTPPAPVAKPTIKPRPRHQQAPIERRTARRIARGAIAIDGRIDLHGSDQAEAHRRLTRYLTDAQGHGWQLVLVITGKGNAEGERGVLRRVVPHWLSSGPLRTIVAGFDQAHRNHGGAGALYVRLRRAADRR